MSLIGTAMVMANGTTKETSKTNRKENENVKENYHLKMSDVQQFVLIATLINNLQSCAGHNFEAWPTPNDSFA